MWFTYKSATVSVIAVVCIGIKCLIFVSQSIITSTALQPSEVGKLITKFIEISFHLWVSTDKGLSMLYFNVSAEFTLRTSVAVSYVVSHKSPHLRSKVASVNQFEHLSTFSVFWTRGVVMHFAHTYSECFIIRHIKLSLILKLFLFCFTFS